MSLLFSPIKIGPMTIKNRFIRSPTYEGLANPDGTPKKRLLNLMEKLSANDVGLIIPGYMYPNENCKAEPKQCAMYNDAHSSAWRSTVNKIHQNGSKIVFQICHPGVRIPEPLERKSPTTFPGLYNSLTKTEIHDIIELFLNSSKQAKKAGAGGVELHGAHGYLFSSFLSPFYNQREDEYGRPIEGRCRFILETAETIRKSCGTDFSILIKMNGSDLLPSNGLTPELASKYVNLLKKKIDLFEISCGCNEIATVRPDTSKRKLFDFTYGLDFKEGYTLSFASVIKKNNPDAVVASVGGFRKAKSMEEAIRKGMVDMISLSRPLIREPNLIKKIKANPNTKSACISCNYCLFNADKNPKGLSCDYP